MKPRVLIVDDLPENRYLLRVLLERHGYTVSEARDGLQALALARAEPPDAAISDLLMPGMDGFALCREWVLDERLRRAPFIVYTATYTDAKDRQLALDIGASDYIVKPTEPEKLLQAILQALARARDSDREPPELPDHSFFERYSNRLKEKLSRKIGQLAQAEHALADYVTRCEAILDASPDAIIAIDDELRIRSWNYSAERLFGYTEPEALEMSLHALIPPDRREEAHQMLAKVREKKNIVRYETQRLRKDGTPVDVSISLSFLGPEIGFVGILADLSALRAAAAEKKELEAQIAQADRLASLGLLAAGIAHEINNPLSYVLYNLESLATELPALLGSTARAWDSLSGHLGREALERIAGDALQAMSPDALRDLGTRFADALSGTRRIRDIARGLGTFARGEEERLVSVSLERVIELAIHMAHNEIKYRARLVKDFGQIPEVMASEGRLCQVFLNLLLNAAHSVEEGDVQSSEILVRTWTEGGQACAEVRDNGKGIQPEHLDRLFEPFFTTSKIGAGSGLGLAISKNIVESYGGTIQVESEPGMGACFTIRLPVSARKEVPPSAGPVPQALPSVRGRVLIVDDEAGIRAIMARILLEHDTVEAADGAAAKAVLETDQAFDVVVCDVMMSGVSGVDLHQWLSETYPGLARRFVFVTGGAFASRARDYLGRVDTARLPKPFDVAEFKRVVGDLVRLAKRGDRAK